MKVNSLNIYENIINRITRVIYRVDNNIRWIQNEKGQGMIQ